MNTYDKINIESEKIRRFLNINTRPSIINIEEERMFDKYGYDEVENNICACNPEPDIEDSLKNWGA